jgi:hypothetical protein
VGLNGQDKEVAVIPLESGGWGGNTAAAAMVKTAANASPLPRFTFLRLATVTRTFNAPSRKAHATTEVGRQVQDGKRSARFILSRCALADADA